MSEPDQLEAWYRDILDTYTVDQRKAWYGTVADAYNRFRPRYPQELIDSAIEAAHLPLNATLLEIGCGPGTATTAFAQLGYSMVCLEPSQAACQLAQQNCAQYPNVTIQTTTFEEWQLDAQRFDAVLSATAFHWVSPDIRYVKAATALQDNGSLILLWNTPPQPKYDVYQVMNEVYQAQAPLLARYENRTTQAEQLRKIGQAAIDAGLFKNLVSQQIICEMTYGIDEYLALLSTLSPYIALEPEKRTALFEGLSNVLERKCGERIETSYLSMFHVAQKT
jgi:SAM-dependent methyltransferase